MYFPSLPLGVTSTHNNAPSPFKKAEVTFSPKLGHSASVLMGEGRGPLGGDGSGEGKLQGGGASSHRAGAEVSSLGSCHLLPDDRLGILIKPL